MAGMTVQMFSARHNHLRTRGGGHARVTSVELFFDLVFVFAVTQLSTVSAMLSLPTDVLSNTAPVSTFTT